MTPNRKLPYIFGQGNRPAKKKTAELDRQFPPNATALAVQVQIDLNKLAASFNTLKVSGRLRLMYNGIDLERMEEAVRQITLPLQKCEDRVYEVVVGNVTVEVVFHKL